MFYQCNECKLILLRPSCHWVTVADSTLEELSHIWADGISLFPLCQRATIKIGTFDWLHTHKQTTPIPKTNQNKQTKLQQRPNYKLIVIQYILTRCRFTNTLCACLFIFKNWACVRPNCACVFSIGWETPWAMAVNSREFRTKTATLFLQVFHRQCLAKGFKKKRKWIILSPNCIFN